jgi:iron complex outermembrane receptor protein
MFDRPKLNRCQLLLAGCAAAALTSAHPAFAAAPDTQVSEVVVTAEKRSENIQTVPAAVSSVSSQLLADTHATALLDIGAYVPALQINSGGTPGQTTISIRGIAPIGPGATVATYIDDSPVGSSSAYGGGVLFALDLLPYDVERLEVLRGPQGTLYGASSMGGLLKYVLTTPSLTKFSSQVGADLFGMDQAGKPGGGVRGSISGPLIEDKLAATASFALENTPGFIDNPDLGKKDQNGYQQLSARLGLVWQPVDNLSVKANALYQRVDADGDSNVGLDPTTLQPIAGRWSDNNLTPQPFIKDLQFYSATIDYSMPWGDFVSATSYADTRTRQTLDESYIYGIIFPAFGLPAGTSQSQYRLHLKKVTQEFRLQSPAGAKLEWLGGVFITNEDSTNGQRPDARLPSGEEITAISPIFDAQLPSTYTEYAAFGDLTYHVTDRFDILGGVRYSQNYQSFTEVATSVLLGDVNLPTQKSQEGVATYSVGAKYRFTDKVLGYVRVASGYQPGGPNIVIGGSPPSFRSDTLTNYEVGVKSQFLDNRLLFDADVFDIEWNDIQLLTTTAGLSTGANGGTATSRGVEANGSIRPIEGLSIDGSFAYVDAHLTQDVPAINGLSGDQLPNIPRYSGSVRASYTRPISGDWSASVGGGLRMQDARVSDVNHAPDSRGLPGFGALDLDASLFNGRYTLRLFAKNVTDTHAYLTYNTLENGLTSAVSEIEASVLQPRVIGVAIDAKF